MLYTLLSLVAANPCNHGHSGPPPAPPAPPGEPLPYRRPAPANRTFKSPALESAVQNLLKKQWHDPDLATLLMNCLPNTLDTTVWSYPQNETGTTFISTGDIPAMWLRDSHNQVLPYMRWAREDAMGSLLRGLIRRHVDSVLHDPYANSFDFSPADKVCNPGAWTKDNTTCIDPRGKRVNCMTPGVHQRKWEMDSLSSVLRLGRLFFAETGDARPFGDRWRDAVRAIVDTFTAQQMPLTPDNFTSVNYTFQTLTHEPKDTSPHGIGRAHRWTGAQSERVEPTTF
jgi:meiotically up-regulated gene 157 (Mug157) protein